MGMGFGIGATLGGLKAIGRKNLLAKRLAGASAHARPFITKTGEQLKEWGEGDWQHFKDTYRPLDEAIVGDANRAPEYNRYDREASLNAARGERDAMSGVINQGVPPTGGRTASRIMDIASDSARAAGVGKTMGHLQADEVATNKKLAVIGRSTPDPSATIAGLGLVAKGGAEYGKYAGEIRNSAGKAFGSVGYGIGKMAGGFGSKSENTNSDGPDFLYGGGGSSSTFNASTYDPGEGYSDMFADGGVVHGPGTGRSDSIPATIDGQIPAAVSNGEYRISAAVARRIGHDRLNKIIAASQRR